MGVECEDTQLQPSLVCTEIRLWPPRPPHVTLYLCFSAQLQTVVTRPTACTESQAISAASHDSGKNRNNWCEMSWDQCVLKLWERWIHTGVFFLKSGLNNPHSPNKLMLKSLFLPLLFSSPFSIFSFSSCLKYLVSQEKRTGGDFYELFLLFLLVQNVSFQVSSNWIPGVRNTFFFSSKFSLALHGVFWILPLIINRHAFAKLL